MPEYSEQDLKYAAEFREEIHKEALAKVKAVYPDADHVVDGYPADAYFQRVWDYPGTWYMVVGTPSRRRRQKRPYGDHYTSNA